MTTKLWGRARTGLAPLIASTALGGCARAHFELLEPAGDIGAQERTLILLSLGIMLCVVIPVIILTLVFAWRYRASNTRATYAPNWSHSNAIEAVVWSIPCVIVLFLAVLIWKTTHTLDPYRPLNSEVKPVRVEVVAMNWKWLFIYPDYGIAAVNQLPIPTNTPINFQLTSDGIMNSFFIPQLGSQVYAMAGMQTQLHLIANKTGSYAGMSSAFSGPGFSDMHFQAIAMSPDRFAAWTRQAASAPAALDGPGLALLERPSIKVPPATYGRVAPGLFEGVVDQFMTGRMSQTALMTATPPRTPNGHASRRVD
ncbi:MAG TPA: ubiquinol oxidase subunit II [Caulobacteraceae bacterium]|nr:ubiquinol oxidase subunit II [Caulobacteraceae bacterium]